MDDLKQNKKGFSKMTFLFGFLAGIAIFSLISFVLLAVNRCLECRAVVQKEQTKKEEPQNQPPPSTAQPQKEGMESKIVGQVGTFYEVSEPICKRNGKPLVFMFSTSWCPHCQWAKPMFQKVVKDYTQKGKILAYQWELDTNDDTLTASKETAIPPEDMALYEKYNPQGSIPTFVFGCKYYRIGTGHERTNDTAAEEKEFKELIDKLLK
ncbi:MAG: TlpA family protein disulfide reductase [Patescibacteria group bacterium]